MLNPKGSVAFASRVPDKIREPNVPGSRRRLVPQNRTKPIVNFRKGTTKVNLGITVGVRLFLSAGALAVVDWARTTTTA